jgi:hypothetical protein
MKDWCVNAGPVSPRAAAPGYQGAVARFTRGRPERQLIGTIQFNREYTRRPANEKAHANSYGDPHQTVSLGRPNKRFRPPLEFAFIPVHSQFRLHGYGLVVGGGSKGDTRLEAAFGRRGVELTP